MAMTSKGIYYPTSGTLAQYPQIFESIALSVDNAIGDFSYDSGWIYISNTELEGLWAGSLEPGHEPRYRRVGDFVQMSGLVMGGSSSSRIFTLPPDMRPTSSQQLLVPVTTPRPDPTSPGHINIRVDVQLGGHVETNSSSVNISNTDMLVLDVVNFTI